MAATVTWDAAAMRTIHALALAVDAKDRYTRNHSERVALYATAVAVHIGLPIDQIEKIAIAGTLHDVGKIAVPDQVLLKPDALTEAESSLVRRHSEEGERMVRALGMDDMDDIALWIRHHHERWDGNGYPDGLAGERIPLPSRILGVADAMDAMTTARAYRRALRLDQATRELLEQAGGQFDPQVAGCLVELLSEGTLTLSEEHRMVTSYAISREADGHLDSEDHQRIRQALFAGGERRERTAAPRISVTSSL
jgi:HD-GYP domain-containing protein (c-di-GMP phosphodiesterase class II)